MTNEFEHDVHGSVVFKHLYEEALNRGDLAGASRGELLGTPAVGPSRRFKEKAQALFRALGLSSGAPRDSNPRHSD